MARETVNLAELYDQPPMPWDRALQALGIGSIRPEIPCLQVDGDAITAPYSAQSAGPPPWHLYRIDVRTAFGVGLREPHGASRWRF